MPSIRVVMGRDEESTYKDAVAQLGNDGSLTIVKEGNESSIIAHFRDGYYNFFEVVEAKVDRWTSEESQSKDGASEFDFQ